MPATFSDSLLVLTQATFRIIAICIALSLFPIISHAQSINEEDIAMQREAAEKNFKDNVAPFVRRYCIDCHQNRRPTEAGVNFSPALSKPGDAAFTEQWKKAIARVYAHDMPPEYADRLPKDEDRQEFLEGVAKIKYLSEKDPGPFVIRRLTKTEYGNTLRDLFGVDPSIAEGLPDEVSGEGYLNSFSPLQLEQYLAVAKKVTEKIFDPENESRTELRDSLLAEPPMASETLETARSTAQKLAKQAYRRPPTEEELNVLLDVFNLGIENGLAYQEAIRLMVKGVLVSPQFLFITPAQEVHAENRIVPLDDYQLASRLSYLLWATTPDEELMALADRGMLHEPAMLKKQVERLLNDPRSRALFDGFGAQWLGIGKLEDQVFDPQLFPQMTSEMRSAMYDEARLLFESIVRENKSVVTFVNGDYTFLNEPLAEIYGLKNVHGPEMRRVELSNSNRGGVLGMPAVLAATSFPNRTSPVKRGVWVLEQVLGDHVPSAPPDVPSLEKQESENFENLTLRERTELHRTDPVCANCHKILDPIGFGLENFDAIGRWREQDINGEPIDASGELPGGKTFSEPKDLKAIMADQPDKLSRNLVEKLLAYALCRKLEGYDEIVIDRLMEDIAADGHRMQTLITAVVTSYPFTHRKIE